LRQILAAAWRVVVQRSRADWLIVAAAWIVVVLATTLLSAGVIYADAVSQGGLRQVLTGAPQTDTSLEITYRARADDAEAADARVSAAVDSALGPARGELVRIGRSESFTLPGQQADRVTDLAVFGSYQRIEEHAELLSGDWPQAGAGPLQAALPQPAAELLGLANGDRLELQSRIRSSLVVPVEVVGIYRASDPEEVYWWDDALAVAGVSEGVSYTTYGPFVVTHEDLIERAIASRVALAWLVLPALEEIDVGDVGGVRAAVVGLKDGLPGLSDRGPTISVDTQLDIILAGVERSLLVSRTGVLLLTVQLAVLAGYALLLISGLLIEQRRAEMALLRSRGASAGHLGVMAAMEGLLLVAPAALAGPWLAIGVLQLFNVAGPLAEIGLQLDLRASDTAFLVAGIAATVCLLALSIPVLFSARALASVRRSIGRQRLRSFAQRGDLDIALIVVAAIGLWQLRQYGAPITRTLRGTFGLDPFLVAAPAIGLLAGALLALRLLPLLARVMERVLSRRSGLVASLGARQLARRPLRYARSALLLMLAAALSVFAASYAGTWVDSQRDQADHQVGADVRVEQSRFGQLPEWVVGDAYRQLNGVQVATAILSDRFSLAGVSAGGQLLALDAAAAEGPLAFRSDLADRPLAELLAELAAGRTDDAGLIRLDGQPQHLALTLDVDLVPGEASPGIPTGWRGATASVVMRDADGLLHRLDAPRLRFDGGEQRVELPLTFPLDEQRTAGPAHPLEMVAVEVALVVTPEARAVGHVELLGIEAGTDGESWQAVPIVGADGWRFVRTFGFGEAEAVEPVPGHPGRFEVGEQHPIASDVGAPELFTLRPDGLSAAAGVLPAIVDHRFLQLTGTRVGEQVTLTVGGRQREISVVGSVRAFPTLDAERPAAIVDTPSLVLGTYAMRGQTASPSEWWLDVDDAAVASVVDQLRSPPFGREVVTARAERAQALLTDPVALGVIGALALGALAAAGFALIGFAVSSMVAARERLTEFALLRAMGLSPRQLFGWLSLESAFLLAIGVLGGTGLGLLLAWTVLPFVTLTQQATAVVPPVRVVIPWELVTLLLGLGLAALAISIGMLSGALRRLHVASILRLGEE
jgi:hypothetical protein